MEEDFKNILSVLRNITEKYQFEVLNNFRDIIVELLNHEEYIDVAVFGQFNAGKSSFLNYVIGKQILPVGILPLTSVITHIFYNAKEKASIVLNNNQIAEIKISELEEYISEKSNPENIKNIKYVDIATNGLSKYSNIRFVDTPGIGSLYKHNSETSQNWLPHANVAIYVVSAERPLSENDIENIKKIRLYCKNIVFIISKTDLFDASQIEEIKEFMDASLFKQFNEQFKIFEYSFFRNNKNQTVDNWLQTINNNKNNELDESIKHKINTYKQQCLQYLKIIYHSSQKSEKEKEELLEYITQEAGNIQFIYKELLLISQVHVNGIRENIFSKLSSFKNEIIKNVEDEFLKSYDSWQGNLYKIARSYETFLKVKLKEYSQRTLNEHREIYEESLTAASEHLLNFAKSFRNKFFNRLYEALGMQPDETPSIIINANSITPDISVSRAFDSHIDLLWFFFPMFLFKKYFKKYFMRQIPYEVEKNVFRLTSDLTEKVNKQINNTRNEILKQLSAEVKMLQQSLHLDKTETNEIYKSILLIEHFVDDIKNEM